MEVKYKVVLGRNKPMQQNTLGIPQVGKKKDQAPCWPQATNVSVCKGKPTSWATLLGGCPVHLRRWSFSSAKPRQDTSVVLGQLLGSSVQGRRGHTEVVTEATGRVGVWNTWHTRRNYETWDCLPSGKRGYCCLQLPHGRPQKSLKLVLGAGPALSWRLN